MLSPVNKKDYDKAYKAYDIRWIYPDQIDEVFAYNIWLWLGREAVKRDGENAKILIGSDVRECNNKLIYRIIVWLKESGVQFITNPWLIVPALNGQRQIWWVCSTSMMYYFTHWSFTFGIPVTASHNPPEYAGMKIVDTHSELIETSILKWYVGDTYKTLPHTFNQDECDKYLNELGYSKEQSIIEEKYKKILTIMEWYLKGISRSITIVADYSNGASIWYEKDMLWYLCNKYNHRLIELNAVADSQFREHLSDTTDYSTYRQLQKAVIENNADIWFMFDGDADRIGFVDEKWEVIAGDVIVAAIAERYLKRSPEWSSVVYDITSSNCIVDIVRAYKWIPIVSRVGHRFVKEKYKESNAIFAWELSGHLFFKELGWFESTIMPAIIILSSLEQYWRMSNVQSEIMKYYKPPIINFKVTDAIIAIETIKSACEDYPQDYLDGVRVNGEWRRFVARPSNTEPVIRFYAEANDKEKYEEIKTKIETILLAS